MTVDSLELGPADDAETVKKTKGASGMNRLWFAPLCVGILVLNIWLSNEIRNDLIVYLCICIPLTIAIMMRLENIGANKLWAIIGLIPVFSLFITCPCMVLPPNYTHHRKLDLASKIMTGVLILTVLLSILFVFLVMFIIGNMHK